MNITILLLKVCYQIFVFHKMVNQLPRQIDPTMVCWESRLYVKKQKRSIENIVRQNEYVNHRVKINYYYYYYYYYIW